MLVVEDNPDDERLVSRTFAATKRPEEYRVAQDGQQALELLTCKVAPALAAGNTLVIKPASYTPLSLLYFAQLTQKRRRGLVDTHQAIAFVRRCGMGET